MAVLERHQDLVEELLAEVEAYKPDADRELLTRAFDFAARAHADQVRRSGQEFIYHPWGVARILAGLQLDEPTLAAPLLPAVVEDTSVELDDVRSEFGDEIAQLVEGVTKLTRVRFQSREHAEAENYRKLIIAMAEDLRVILIKLADRLHNLRTIEYLGKQKQVQKARETLEVYAPLAHRLGIHALKWELEDLSFQTLHPRKYEEIKQMVAERRADREEHVREAALVLQQELDKVDIPADISGRAKHFYSIYDKMVRKGREFNEIYDLTAMRVIAERGGDERTRDCSGALGLIHSLWKPMPGRFKDFVAMPKFNGYRALHTTVIGPQGRPLEIQVRTREMHETAEFGVAAHWLYKRGKSQNDADWVAWVKQLMDESTTDEADPRDGYRRRLRRAHLRRPPHRRRQGQRPHRAPALHAEERRLRRDPHLEAGTRPVARLALAREELARAQQDPAVVLARDARGDRAEGPRRARAGAEGAEAPVREAARLGDARPGDPRLRLQEGRGLLPRARLRESAVGDDRQQGHPAAQDRTGRRGGAGRQDAEGAGRHGHRGGGGRPRRRRRPRAARQVLYARPRRPDRRLHLARQGHHHPSRRLPERARAAPEPGAVHAGRVGRRHGREELPRADRRRLVGPPAAARGRRADLRRARREHRQLRRHGRGPAREELVHGRGGGREEPADAAERAPQPRCGVRRVPRHPELIGRCRGSTRLRPRGSARRPTSTSARGRRTRRRRSTGSSRGPASGRGGRSSTSGRGRAS